MTLKLNQVLAIEKGEKTRSHSAITRLHKTAQKAELYNGFNKTYRKTDEDGEEFPAQRQLVRLRADEVLRQLDQALAGLFDIEATKDVANTVAHASVVVDGEVVLADVPPTFLLFLEKQLNDIYTFISKMPTLSTDEDWTLDHDGTFKTESIPAHKTKKNVKVIVKYDATEHHPAQTDLIQVDEVVGYWDTVKRSGALTVPRREQLLERVVALSKAVKQAREEANMVECVKQDVSNPIFNYLFKE